MSIKWQMEESFIWKPHPLPLNSHLYQPRYLYIYKVYKFTHTAQRWVYLCYYSIAVNKGNTKEKEILKEIEIQKRLAKT